MTAMLSMQIMLYICATYMARHMLCMYNNTYAMNMFRVWNVHNMLSGLDVV